MNLHTNPIERLTEIFRHFPGIGPRQAQRFVYHLLNRPTRDIEELARLIQEVKKTVRQCADCFRYFPADDIAYNGDPRAAVSAAKCSICADPKRDETIIMVVSRDADLDAIEKSGVYKGKYFVLGGSIPILENEPEKRVRLAELMSRIGGLKKLAEIVISLSATPEGDHTADFLRSALEKKLGSKAEIKISTLGRGLSTGSELEYADSDTIRSALENRHY